LVLCGHSSSSRARSCQGQDPGARPGDRSNASQGKEAEPSVRKTDLTQCESEAMLHFFITLVPQSQERRTSNAEDPGGRPGGGATLGVTVIATANPCKIERVGAIPSISTNFLGRGKRLSHWIRPMIPAGVPFALFPRSSAERAAACEAEGRWCDSSRGNQFMDSECCRRRYLS
jgi:hypothetical protein